MKTLFTTLDSGRIFCPSGNTDAGDRVWNQHPDFCRGCPQASRLRKRYGRQIQRPSGSIGTGIVHRRPCA